MAVNLKSKLCLLLAHEKMHGEITSNVRTYEKYTRVAEGQAVHV